MPFTENYTNLDTLIAYAKFNLANITKLSIRAATLVTDMVELHSHSLEMWTTE